MKQLKITICFGRQNEDIYNLLKSKGNVSRFLCNLVREAEQHSSLEARIEKVVSRMLGQNSDVKQDDLKSAADSFDF